MPNEEPQQDTPHRRTVEAEYVAQLRALTKRVERSERLIAGGVQEAVTEGIREAIKDEETWDAFFGALNKVAQEQAGSAAMGGLKWVGRKVLWGLILAAVVYAVGGWTALVAFVKR